MTNPSVSVIVARTVGETETLATLRSQTFQDFETLFCQRNQAVELSNAEYIAFLDSNHLWSPRKLEKQIAIFQANPACQWCYCNAVGFPEVNCTGLRSGNILRSLLLNNFIPPSTVMVRRRAFLQVGAFDDSESHFSTADWDMWLRLAATYPVAFIAESLVDLRNHKPPAPEHSQNRKRLVEATVNRHLNDLRDVRSEALAELCVDEGNALLLADKRNEAREKFAEALTHSPLRPDAYLSWISSFLPTDSQRQVRDLYNLARRIQPVQKSVDRDSVPR